MTTASIMIPAAAFIPTTTRTTSACGGTLPWLSGSGCFTAPLSFPVPVVNIKKITVYAYDNRAGPRLRVPVPVQAG